MAVRVLPTENITLKIKKTIDGKDVSFRSAFESSSLLMISVEAPRVLGASAAVLRIVSDDTRVERDIPLDFFDSREGNDIYRTELTTSVEGIFTYLGNVLGYAERLYVIQSVEGIILDDGDRLTLICLGNADNYGHCLAGICFY